MGTTPTYSWPYPEATDPVADGAQNIEDLALAIEGTTEDLPRGQLVIATSDADFTATTSGVDILNVSVTLTSSRVLRIIYQIGAVSGPSTNLETTAYILDGPYATGTQLNNVTQRIGTAFDANVGWTQVLHSATFAAGTHTFYASAATSTGTCIYNGATTRPHLLIVDDMGAG